MTSVLSVNVLGVKRFLSDRSYDNIIYARMPLLLNDSLHDSVSRSLQYALVSPMQPYISTIYYISVVLTSNMALLLTYELYM